MCRAAGMPPGVLRAYEAYLKALKVYNCVAGGMGTPYVRLCGIPQGCPFSMTNVALIMKPCIVMTKKITGISVYILADDVLIIATGPGVLLSETPMFPESKLEMFFLLRFTSTCFKSRL